MFGDITLTYDRNALLLRSNAVNPKHPAANAAIQEMNWHKMMKAKKTDSGVPSASVSLESMTAVTQPPPSKEEEEPPTKKQKS